MLKPRDSRISKLNFVRHVNIRWLQEAKQTKLSGVTKASLADHKAAAQLLMKALAEKNVPFNFVTSPYFQAYVAFVSGLSYSTPSRYDVVKALEDICDILCTKMQKQLAKTPFLSIQADSWSSAGRHVTAVMGGVAGNIMYLNSYENHGADNAEASAAAIHDCVLASMGLKPDLNPADPSYPEAKVSVAITDTTYVMPATARELRKKPLFKGMLWGPCFPHVANLFLLDQLKIPAVAQLLAHSKQITITFRSGNFRKLFLTYVTMQVVCALRSA
jgi:hypothetical protein